MPESGTELARHVLGDQDGELADAVLLGGMGHRAQGADDPTGDGVDAVGAVLLRGGSRADDVRDARSGDDRHHCRARAGDGDRRGHHAGLDEAVRAVLRRRGRRLVDRAVDRLDRPPADAAEALVCILDRGVCRIADLGEADRGALRPLHAHEHRIAGGFRTRAVEVPAAAAAASAASSVLSVSSVASSSSLVHAATRRRPDASSATSRVHRRHRARGRNRSKKSQVPPWEWLLEEGTAARLVNEPYPDLSWRGKERVSFFPPGSLRCRSDAGAAWRPSARCGSRPRSASRPPRWYTAAPARGPPRRSACP